MTDIKVGDTVRIKASAEKYASEAIGATFTVTGFAGYNLERGPYATGHPGGVFLDDLELAGGDRWRYNDHIVVYPETRDQGHPYNNTLGRGVTILDETPLPKIYTRWENQSTGTGSDEISEAAKAYFEAHEPNPVIKEAKVRGDYAYFAYQLRYNDSAVWLEKYTKADIDAALPVIDRLALKASE